MHRSKVCHATKSFLNPFTKRSSRAVGIYGRNVRVPKSRNELTKKTKQKRRRGKVRHTQHSMQTFRRLNIYTGCTCSSASSTLLSASRASSWGRSCRSRQCIRSSRLTLSIQATGVYIGFSSPSRMSTDVGERGENKHDFYAVVSVRMERRLVFYGWQSLLLNHFAVHQNNQHCSKYFALLIVIQLNGICVKKRVRS